MSLLPMRPQTPNKSLQPTPVGACSSATRFTASPPAWLSFFVRPHYTLMEYLPVITAFFGAAAGVIAPFLIPGLSDFLLARSIERYKLTLIQKQKAEKITELFAYMPRTLAGGDFTKDDEMKINQLILELALYLPKDLVCELTKTICDPIERQYYRRCFIKVRAHLLGRDDGLVESSIPHFTHRKDAASHEASKSQSRQ